MKYLLLMFALLLCINVNAQIHERWDVKTITDGFSPNLNSVRRITVAHIATMAKVPIRNTQPRLNFERQVIKITGTITRIKLENGAGGDNDYHIEISDGSLGDSTLVCESVDPANSITATSLYVSNFKSVRNVVKNKKVGDRVTFTGVVFHRRC